MARVLAQSVCRHAPASEQWLALGSTSPSLELLFSLLSPSVGQTQQRQCFATRKDEEAARKNPRDNTRWRKWADDLLEEEQDAPDLLAGTETAQAAAARQQGASEAEPMQQFQQTLSEAQAAGTAGSTPETEAQLEDAARYTAQSGLPEAAGIAAALAEPAAPQRTRAADPGGPGRRPAPAAAAASGPGSQAQEPARLLSREEALQALRDIRKPINPRSGRSLQDQADAERSAVHGRIALPEPVDSVPSMQTGYSELGSTMQPSFQAAFNTTGNLNPHRTFLPGQMYTPKELVGPGEPHYAQEKPVERLASAYVARQATFTHLLLLDNYITDAGRLHPRKRTGLGRKVQSKVVRQIKTARTMALMSPTGRHPALLGEFENFMFDDWDADGAESSSAAEARA